MSQSVEYWKVVPEPFKHLYAFSTAVGKGFADRRLMHLVWLRASQINGCAFCIDMHVKEALKDGESPERLHLVAGWREAGGRFTEAERAALRWTEALTELPGSRGPDVEERRAARAEVEKHYSAEEVVNLAYAIASINAWNRLGVGFEREP